MSDEKKCFARPKVRFSRSTESPDKSDAPGAFAKPKIRSVVDFKPTVTILKPPSSRSNEETHSSTETTSLRHSAGDAPNDLRLCPLKTTSGSAPCLTEIILTPNNQSSKVRSQSKKRETSEKKAVASPKESSAEHKEKSSGISSSTILDKTSEIKSGESCSGQGTSRSKLSENRLGKENIASSRVSKENVPKVPQNTPRTRNDVQKKSAPISVKKTIATGKPESVSKPRGDVRKIVRTKAAPIGLMPCMKAAQSRRPSAPTRKTILRDATAAPSQVYVGPGVARPRSVEPEARPVKEKLRSRSEILSGDKLSRPEYNSIVNTMKALRDAREEGVPRDLEHLPAVYRRLVNGKVSSALDFGANEAIYRDLVDLSIDEKQLPSRVTRSKDPEPRQRDLVPKLSDFFVPSNDEEFRKAVIVRPPSPRVLDIWNPYKFICDRRMDIKIQLLVFANDNDPERRIEDAATVLKPNRRAEARRSFRGPRKMEERIGSDEEEEERNVHAEERTPKRVASRERSERGGCRNEAQRGRNVNARTVAHPRRL